MNIREKRAPKHLSLAAIGVSVALSAWIWAAGISEPRTYTMTMNYNHHSGYGAAAVTCQECHIPVSESAFSLMTEMNCTTAQCHGELTDEVSEKEKLKMAQELMFPIQGEEALQQGKRYLAQHERAAREGMSCVDCHSEHTPTTKPHFVPEWWDEVDPQDRQVSRADRIRDYRPIL